MSLKFNEKCYILQNCEIEEIEEMAKKLNVSANKVRYYCSIHKLPYKKRPKPILTNREIEVLALVSKGLTNKEIANKLFISKITVKCHIANIWAKLDIPRKDNEVSFMRVQATLWYLKNIKGINLEDC